VIATAFVSAASADNYGTTRSEAASMTRLVYQTFGSGWEGRCMVRIMWRESGGNPHAANYGDSNGGSYGLLQLNGVHRWAGESLAAFQRRMWNPYSHLAAAKRLYDRGGFAAWGGCA
jgi:SLT domain-containing protein